MNSSLEKLLCSLKNESREESFSTLFKALTDNKNSQLPCEPEPTSEKQNDLKRSIELVDSIYGFLPENKKLKADLVRKLLECAIIVDKIKLQSIN